jgi:hypothetical protein
VYEEHECFQPPHDPEATVWRYMDLSKFVLLVDRGALYFPRADLLGDPHEGALPAGVIAARDEMIEALAAETGLPVERFANLVDADAASYLTTVQGTFINCWNLSEHESAALWASYGKGIAIRSTFARLRESLRGEERVYIGRVRYIDYGDPREGFPRNNVYWQIIHKRLYFSSENELRAVVPGRAWNESGQLTGDPRPGVEIPVDLGTLIEEIYVAPGAAVLGEAVRAVVTRFGLDVPVHQSSLDEAPRFA